jgi:hypothetical protein
VPAAVIFTTVYRSLYNSAHLQKETKSRGKNWRGSPKPMAGSGEHLLLRKEESLIVQVTVVKTLLQIIVC